MDVTQSIWELNTGRKIVSIFERGCPLPAEKSLLMQAIFDNQTSMEFEILKDGLSFFLGYLNLSVSIRREEKLEIIFKINNAESFDVRAKVQRTGENIQITKIPKISDYYRRLSSMWGYDDIYAILSIAHYAPQDDIETAFAYKRLIHKSSEEIISIITRAYSEVNTPNNRRKLYLQKVIINDLSKKLNFYENEPCKDTILIHCMDRIKENFFTLIEMQKNVIQRTILEIEKPTPIHLPGLGKKDHLGITEDEAEEGTNISLGGMSIEGEKLELEIRIPSGISDGLVPIPNEGKQHDCIPGLKGDATIKVKVIPIDARTMTNEIGNAIPGPFHSGIPHDLLLKDCRNRMRVRYTDNDVADWDAFYRGIRNEVAEEILKELQKLLKVKVTPQNREPFDQLVEISHIISNAGRIVRDVENATKNIVKIKHDALLDRCRYMIMDTAFKKKKSLRWVEKYCRRRICRELLQQINKDAPEIKYTMGVYGLLVWVIDPFLALNGLNKCLRRT